MNLSEIKVFRMTHIDNIPHILQNGITHKNSPNANVNYVSIGDNSLIDTRASKTIQVTNGTLDYGDAKRICLGDFIPFYFWLRMPMLYIIQRGFHNVVKRNPEEIVYLVCIPSKLADQYSEVYFSDGHAADKFSVLYDKTALNKIGTILDWKAIKARDWGGDQNLDIKRKKEAEFLVKADIASDFIIGFGCYNEVAKQKLISFGIEEVKIKVIHQYYY
ncbi:type II toxin-antitoxin system toxin DNA ADP-ribosyl transferase DarT [Capnocytophaga canis]|uniref:DarT domain-containing protein n=1 Tax=Capnocytophaga canis TaxID=1848903 RepID=A0A0B7IUM8_9FLAO|nr:DUF4433 domain-containing protein [Capnocytophaga canis]CEN54334.1 conserved hypothetical protein [Capnocytophaga canis]